jgi:hypothetical protein
MTKKKEEAVEPVKTRRVKAIAAHKVLSPVELLKARRRIRARKLAGTYVEPAAQGKRAKRT